MPSSQAHPADHHGRPWKNGRRLRIAVVTKLPRPAGDTMRHAVEDAAALLSLHGHQVIDAGAVHPLTAAPGRRPLWARLVSVARRLPLPRGRWWPGAPARAEDLLARADVLIVPARATEPPLPIAGSPVIYPVTVGYGHKADSTVLQLIAEPHLLSSLHRLADHIERDQPGNRNDQILEGRKQARRTSCQLPDSS